MGWREYFFVFSDVMCVSEKNYFKKKKKKTLTKFKYNVFYTQIIYSKQLTKYY